MNKTLINEYILVWKAFLQDNDPGKLKRLKDMWVEMTSEEHLEIYKWDDERKENGLKKQIEK